MTPELTAASERILIVEDDLERARLVSRMLLGLGFQVEHVASGEACIESLQGSLPRLVLLDVVLPGMDGLQVLAEIRARPAWKRLAVVMLSSLHTESSEQAGGLEAGADGYIAWPMPKREFLARVNLALRYAAIRDPGQPASSACSAGLKSANQLLTARQLELVRLIARGMGTKQAAQVLGIAVRTAETHRADAMRRLGLHNTAELVSFVLEQDVE